MSEKSLSQDGKIHTRWRHFSETNCHSYGSTVRKQWALHSNDAVSIFQSWQGGQSSGIIVMRPTGCPEEEVSAESYVSIQGRGGARQGSSHRASFLLLSSRVSLERRAASLTQDAMTFLRFFIGREFIITPPPLTWIEMTLMKKKWKHKSEKRRGN